MILSFYIAEPSGVLLGIFLGVALSHAVNTYRELARRAKPDRPGWVREIGGGE